MSILKFQELMSSWIGDGLRPVHREDAQKRANVCLSCPHNKGDWTEIFKNKVALTIRRQIELKNKMNMRVDGEKSLHLCGVCHCVLRLKVHVPIEFINETTDDKTMKEFPSHCWVVKENQ